MTPDSQRKGGRPRGSGNTAVRLDLQLTPAQKVPFGAGYRIGQADHWFAKQWDGTAGDLSPLLLPAERAALGACPDEWFCEWVTVGLKAADVVEYASRIAEP